MTDGEVKDSEAMAFSGPRSWMRFAWANIKFVMRGGFVLPNAHRLQPGGVVPNDFFGICVASSPDPASDQYMIEQLRELGIRHVRLDYTYSSAGDYVERFLKALLEEGIQVCLHLVQPLEAAKRMQSPDAQSEWRQFVTSTLALYGPQVELVELGSTCNRRRWAGYTLETFQAAWSIAHAVATEHAVTIAAPNVTDFEPFYNVGLLELAKHNGLLPAIHTDNLFAERATEPENYDPKILGKTFAPLIQYNLVKKAALLRRITQRYGIERLMCGHVAWSERRIRRLLVSPREKQADYLQRYLCLLAASGTFNRIYWGPMVGQREGVIDDGTTDYPEDHQHVTLYDRALGSVSDYQHCPSFYALKTSVSMLSGMTFVRDYSTGRHLRVLEFTKGDGCLHVIWTTNGNGFDPQSWYDAESLGRVSATNRDGGAISSSPCIIGESPVFLQWEGQPPSYSASTPNVLKQHRFFAASGSVTRRVSDSKWQGVVVTAAGEDADAIIRDLHPTQLELTADKSILRDSRNRVWSCELPSQGGSVVVKRSQVRSVMRRLLDQHKPSRSLRSWNGTSELLRRGIATPRPIAFFEDATRPQAGVGYYICETFPFRGSVRNAFYDFARDAAEYEGIAKAVLYRELAAFVRHMHLRGVYFRDLSAGFKYPYQNTY